MIGGAGEQRLQRGRRRWRRARGRARRSPPRRRRTRGRCAGWRATSDAGTGKDYRLTRRGSGRHVGSRRIDPCRDHRPAAAVIAAVHRSPSVRPSPRARPRCPRRRAPTCEDFEFESLHSDYTLGRDSEGVLDAAALSRRSSCCIPDFDQNRGLVRAIPTHYETVDTELSW